MCFVRRRSSFPSTAGFGARWKVAPRELIRGALRRGPRSGRGAHRCLSLDHPRMSLSFMMSRSLPSILTSVPDHFPKSTRSPRLTSRARSCRSHHGHQVPRRPPSCLLQSGARPHDHAEYGTSWPLPHSVQGFIFVRRQRLQLATHPSKQRGAHSRRIVAPISEEAHWHCQASSAHAPRSERRFAETERQRESTASNLRAAFNLEGPQVTQPAEAPGHASSASILHR